MHKRVYRYNNYLPIKVNFAGVMPPILASTLISLLLSITSPYLKYTLSNGHLLYQLIFSFLVVLFSYFYTINQLDLDSIVKNMKKLSIFIPNIRPGEKTKTYLREAIYRIILIGALYLICLCSFPIILQKILLNDIAFFFGGTTILLISTIIIDLVRKINNMLVMKRYLEFKHFWNYILSNTLKK
jgi:preprotein translocase subunit SecY